MFHNKKKYLFIMIGILSFTFIPNVIIYSKPNNNPLVIEENVIPEERIEEIMKKIDNKLTKEEIKSLIQAKERVIYEDDSLSVVMLYEEDMHKSDEEIAEAYLKHEIKRIQELMEKIDNDWNINYGLTKEETKDLIFEAEIMNNKMLTSKEKEEIRALIFE